MQLRTKCMLYSSALRRVLLNTTTTPSHHRRQTLLFSSLPDPEPVVLAPEPTTPLTHESVLYVLKKLERHPLKALAFFHHASTNLRFKPNPTIYSLLLRSLAHKHSISHFWAVAQRMEQDGHSIDGGVYFTILVSFKKQRLLADAARLTQFFSRTKAKAKANDGDGDDDDGLRAVVDAVVSATEEEQVGEKLDELKLSPSESSPMVAEVLQELRHRPSKALGFFRWAARNSNCGKLGSAAYNSMVRVLAHSESSVGEFWALVEEMRREGHQIDIDTYIKVLRQFQKTKMLDDAVRLYELMMDGPYKPAIHDCGLLLRQISLADQPDLGLVSRVVNKYEASGHSMSKVVYDGILRSLTRSGRFEEAGKVMEKMKNAGFEPDNITHSQLVFGLCKAKRLDEARKVLDEMEASGCFPDVKTWTILIQGHCSVGEIDAALGCLTNMIAKNYNRADGELVDVMVKGLCKVSRVTDAHTLFLEMVGKGSVKPRQATYKYLIHKLLEGRNLEEALKLLAMMKRHQLPPFADPFTPYISKFGTVEDAKEFLKALNAKKECPSPPAYLFLFKSFFHEGRYSEAQDLLFKSPHHIRKHSDISKLFGSIQPGNAT